MARRIALALAIHNHQPVGNFGWVLAEVFEHAYEPMIAALERHPHVRLSLHYSGPLLDWFRAERPEFIDRLRGLIARDQVEIMGGGYYEPVLASLPERDRIGQATRMADEVATLFGRRPAGAWLAERVWEPDLPTSLAAAGYDWTILDDAHFRAAAIGEDDLWGAYITDDQGQRLRVFGTEQGLRYRIPFRDVDDVISYLRGHASEDGDRIGTMGDDGEKFGAWPTTWEHCWGARRWMDRFFAALGENADWLSTTTPSDWLAAHPPIGRVYVPTGSYVEMGQWALPPTESVAFGAALHAAQAEDRPEVRWLRGASWRNFQVRYREINDLHKQMLRTSDKVAAMPDGAARDLATNHLYQGQGNDCYWHGLFGGIYIAHMRLASYANLIAAEDLADTAAGLVHMAEALDLDLDGHEDVRLATAGQVVSVDLADGAGIGGWDIRPVRHALCAVMRRRPEAYHGTLLDEDAAMLESAPDNPAELASIHDRLAMKEAGLAARLHYDAYERRSGLVRFLAPATDAEVWATAEAIELGDAVDGAFEIAELALDRLEVTRAATVMTPTGPTIVDVTKTVELGGDRRAPSLALTVAIHNRSAIPVEARIGLEWTLMLLGGGANPAAWWEVDEVRSAHDAPGTADAISHIAQGNDNVGVAVSTIVSEPATAWWAPVETISNSEGGFERVYQGAGLLLSWPLALAPAGTWSVTVTQMVTTDRDGAEAAAIS
jgi:alpha-amylase